MKFRKFSGMALATLMVATSLVGCGGSENPSTDTKGTSNNTSNSTEEAGTKVGPNGEQLAEEQIAYGMLYNVITFDTAQVGDSESGSFFAAVGEGLFRENQGELENAGCESYEVSEDGLTYTFHLRKNKWSDGQEVVASQYVDAVKRTLTPELGCSYAFFTFPIKNAEAYYKGEVAFEEVGVKAIDDYTLEYTLEKPEAYFIEKLSYTVFYPIRTDIIEQYGDTYGTDATQVLSCGPFMVEEWTQNQDAVLVKNPNYWDAENVFIEEIQLQQVNETATQYQLFEAGQLDYVSGIGDYIEKWDEKANNGECQLYTRADVTSQYIAFNTQENNPSGIMQNAKVRKAIAYSLDSQTFIDSVYSGRFIAANGIVPSSITVDGKSYREAVEEPMAAEYREYANNPEKLQALLHEGLKELGKDTNDLSKIKVQFLGYGETTIEKDVEQFVVQRIQDNLGIKVDLNIVGDFGLAQAAQVAGEFDLCLLGWSADYNDPMTFIDIFRTNGGSNYGKYSNERYDAILAELENEQDPAKRIELYGEAENILLLEDAAIKPLLYRDVHAYVNNRLQNFQYPMFGPKYEFRYAYVIEE